MLRRLVAEWRSAKQNLGLPVSASFADVARTLDVDRGTAQRLTRIAKLSDVSAEDLSYFPGVRGWHRVTAGVKRSLGTDHPSVKTLSRACDEFADLLTAVGGSRSAAVRQIAAGAQRDDVEAREPSTPGLPKPGHERNSQTARARLVDAAAEVIGYSVQTLVNMNIVRDAPPPPDGGRRQMDLVTINLFKSCTGTAAAAPLAFTRVAYTQDFTAIAGSGGSDPQSFHILRSMTTNPPPAILSTGNEVRQTIFVEPQWTSRAEPLDIGLLHEEKSAFPSPWGTDKEWLEFFNIVRHPTRRLILDRVVSRFIDAECVAALRVFRTHSMLAHEEPWFDRLAEEAPVRRLGNLQAALDSDVFPGYRQALLESLDHLKWDNDDLVFYRAVIDNPIPLATYNVTFDRVKR